MKPTGNQKEDGVGPFRSQHAAPDWPNLLSRQIRIGNVSACSLCHETVVKKRQSEWFLFVPPPPTVQSMLSIHSSAFDNSGTPTTVNNMSRIFMFLFLSDSWNLSGFLLWEFNACFQWFFLFVVSHADIFTEHFNWFDAPPSPLNVRPQKIVLNFHAVVLKPRTLLPFELSYNTVCQATSDGLHYLTNGVA